VEEMANIDQKIALKYSKVLTIWKNRCKIELQCGIINVLDT